MGGAEDIVAHLGRALYAFCAPPAAQRQLAWTAAPPGKRPAASASKKGSGGKKVRGGGRQQQVDLACEVCGTRAPWSNCGCQVDKWKGASFGWWVKGTRAQCPTCMGQEQASNVPRARAINEFLCRFCIAAAAQ